MRFRWRDLLIPTAILTVIRWFLLRPGDETHGQWVGHADVRLDFVLIDADSERPIAGASILLRDADFLGDPPDMQHEPHCVQATSDPEGHARIDVLLHGSWGR